MIKISGTGSYLPERVMTNIDLEKLVETTDAWIKKRTGISERRIAANNEATTDLAVNAALKALEMAKLRPIDIDMIILGTSTPDYPIPASAPIIQKKLGCRKIPAFDINSVCSSFTVALLNAYSLLATGLYNNCLVIGADTYSRILNWQDRGSCILFGDGAGAAIVQRDDRHNNLLSHVFGVDGDGANLIMVPKGGSKSPIHSIDDIKDPANLFFQMDGRSVYEFTIDVVPKVILDLLAQAHLETTDIDWVLLHQANIRIVDGVSKYLDIPKDKFLVNIEKVGNTSSASIPILLDDAVRSGKIKTGDKVMMIGFGGGLSWGGLLIEW